MTIATFKNNLVSARAGADLRAADDERAAPQRLCLASKAAADRWSAVSIMAVLFTMTAVQAIFVVSFYAPAHGGTDQNGYHVTARLLSEGHGASFRLVSPFMFVGSMMVLTQDGRVYAKYPPGYPLLAAAARLTGGPKAMYLVDPICTVIASSFSYFLFRKILGRFASLCAVLWLSWNPLVLFFANDGNSHASTLLCIVVGAWGMISWIQGEATWRGVLGACCFGCAATIRFSECLLLLPVLFAVATQISDRGGPLRALWRRSVIVLLGWAIPVVSLSIFCWAAFGAPWKTGYSFCAEDSGFGLMYFLGNLALHRPGNWETLIVQMNWMGLFMLWPIGVAGLIALIGVCWREGAFIALWALPSTMLYLCYYWAPSGESSLGYLRFFLTIIPAFILCAMWMIESAVSQARTSGVIGLGVITALGICANLCNTLPALESSLVSRQALAHVNEFIHSRIPSGSGVFVADEGISNCLDAAGGFKLYNLQLFRNSSFSGFDRIINDSSLANQPDPRQRARIALYWQLLSSSALSASAFPKSNQQLMQAEDQLLDQLLREGTRVFFLLKTGQNKDLLPDASRWISTVVDSDVCYPNAPVPRPIGSWNTGSPAPEDKPWFETPVTWTIYQITRT